MSCGAAPRISYQVERQSQEMRSYKTEVDGESTRRVVDAVSCGSRVRQEVQQTSGGEHLPLTGLEATLRRLCPGIPLVNGDGTKAVPNLIAAMSPEDAAVANDGDLRRREARGCLPQRVRTDQKQGTACSPPALRPAHEGDVCHTLPMTLTTVRWA